MAADINGAVPQDGKRFEFIKAITVEYENGETSKFTLKRKRVMNKRWRKIIDKFALWRFVRMLED